MYRQRARGAGWSLSLSFFVWQVVSFLSVSLSLYEHIHIWPQDRGQKGSETQWSYMFAFLDQAVVNVLKFRGKQFRSSSPSSLAIHLKLCLSRDEYTLSKRTWTSVRIQKSKTLPRQLRGDRTKELNDFFDLSPDLPLLLIWDLICPDWFAYFQSDSINLQFLQRHVSKL